MNNETFALRKSGRVVYPFPWASSKVPCPWKAGYTRVIIPLSAKERQNSNKTCHIQIVRNDNLIKSGS